MRASRATGGEGVVIIGGGQAAAATAVALRQLGFDGPVTLFAEERHLPYERPVLSKEALHDAAHEISPILTEAQAAGYGITITRPEPVRAIDRSSKRITVGDDRVPYWKLVIATGGRARSIEDIAADNLRVFQLRTIDDAAALAKAMGGADSLAVVGGGWLGLEIAAAGRRRGLKTMVFERSPRLCARVLPAEVGAFLSDLHASNDVQIMTNAVLAISRENGKIVVTHRAGVARVDLLVVATGMDANDELARAANLACDGGILTGATGATADPDIFAVGDCARQRLPGHDSGVRLESWHNANTQAQNAAHAITGRPAPPPSAPWFWSTQYDTTISIVGLPDPNRRPDAVDAADPLRPLWVFGAEAADGFIVAVDRPADVRRFRNARSRLAASVAACADPYRAVG